MRYIIDSRYFDGTCLTSMSDDMHSDYGGETLEALREREKNPYLVAVPPVRMTLLVKRYTRALCKPFHEITEERYYELLECLPPARMQSDWFFVGEPYYRNLYALCFESDGRYFRAERPIRLSMRKSTARFREHMEKVNLHPAIVKKASFVKYVNWYKKTVTYIPYYFEYGGKIYFLKNLATRTGSEFGDRRERNEMAALLRNLRGNRYEYCTFYSQKKDIFEFLTGYGRTNTRWKSRATCSTLRMTAPTWTFTAMYASIRLCSITASIHASFLAISLTSYAP